MNVLRSLSKVEPFQCFLQHHSINNSPIKRLSHRKSSVCSRNPRDKRPCLDYNDVIFERGHQCYEKLIRSFLFTHYWPREPSIVSLWMGMDSPYLETLTAKYSNLGNRILAFERIKRTNELQLIGVAVANKVCPWMIRELEEWAHNTQSKPEKHHMYFKAHCYSSPNLFQKFNVEYLYDVEVLGTSSDVTGHGVGTRLLQNCLADCNDLGHPLVQVVSTSAYCEKICLRNGMKKEWTMQYSDFVNDAGQSVFFPRRPHHNVSVYVKTLKELRTPPCRKPFGVSAD